MRYLVPLALAAFLGAMALAFSGRFAPAAHVHLAFALGVLPLILGAMAYFVPVLTRSHAAPASLALLPWLAAAAGATVALALAAGSHLVTAFNLAAGLALLAVLTLLGWIIRRADAMLGSPHPCLDWYLAALACLALGLLAILAMNVWPDQYSSLKRLHLHLNLLGFVGLTALGTLQVLLPTVAGGQDPEAAPRMKRDLWPALAGVLLVAFGAAFHAALAWAGIPLLLWPLLRALMAWRRRLAGRLGTLHGAAPSLVLAALGLLLVLAAGAFHGAGRLGAAALGHAFAAGFLFPLVTGAATHLLPQWILPEARERQAGLRAILGRHAGLRAGLFLAGAALLATGQDWGWLPALLGLAWFVTAGAWGLVKKQAANLNKGDGVLG